MLKQVLMFSTILISSTTFAACVEDTPEIGDIGPSSSYVCEILSGQDPRRETVIHDRTILTPDSVSISLSFNGRPYKLRFVRSGFDWVLMEEAVASQIKD